MDRGNRADLALCRGERRSNLEGALVWHAACLSQRHVCLHLALFRQYPHPRLARHRAGGDDGYRKLYRCDRGMVDLAQQQKSRRTMTPIPLVSAMSKETLFALSLFPYLAFLWFLTRSGKTPKLALIGFYMLLIFVAVTIPAGIYAKVAYGDQLANIDWLHGGAEFFLTLSNILVVLGFRQAIIDKTQSSNSKSV